jgi:hypothetical protein
MHFFLALSKRHPCLAGCETIEVKGVPAKSPPSAPTFPPESAWPNEFVQPFQVFAPTDQKPGRCLNRPGSISQQSKPKIGLTNANTIDNDHANCHGSGQNPALANAAACIRFSAMERIRGGRAARVTCCSGRSCQRLHLASIKLDLSQHGSGTGQARPRTLLVMSNPAKGAARHHLSASVLSDRLRTSHFPCPSRCLGFSTPTWHDTGG